MKKILFGLVVVATLVACGEKNPYTISGTLSGKASQKDSATIYLAEDSKGKVLLDSVIVKDGKFEFKGNADKAEYRYIGILVSEKKHFFPFVLETGLVTANIGDEIEFTGTPLNDKIKIISKERADINAQMATLSQEIRAVDESEKEKREELIEKFNGLRAKSLEASKAVVKGNTDNVVGAFTFAQIFSAIELDEAKEMLALFSDDLKTNNKNLKRVSDRISAIENTQIGKTFVDIKGLTTDGKEAKLSDYAGKGKIVLLDFWATWCGPCIAELPHVKKAYETYKDKGFEIVGVSLDFSKEEWVTGSEKLEIAWPQFSNIEGWEERGAQAYGVSSIPHTVLIDGEGIIIEKNLRGDALSEKLGELLK